MTYCPNCSKEISEGFNQESIFTNRAADTFCDKKCAKSYLQAKANTYKNDIKNSLSLHLIQEAGRIKFTLDTVNRILKNFNKNVKVNNDAEIEF